MLFRSPDDAPYYYASQNSSWQPKINIYRVVQNENSTNEISTRIDPAGGADFIWNTPFVLDPNNNQIMYLAGGKMLWRNNNLAEIPFVNSKDSTSINWDSLSHTRIDYINTAPLGERITAVSVSKKPANIVYYGTSSGNVFKIIDANIGNPEPIKISNQNIPKGYISSIAIDPDNADEVIVSLSNYGILSVLLQAFYEIEYLFTVHENAFTPPPKVKSAVIRLTRNAVQKLDCDEVLFKKVVKTAFNQRRKTIRNSIRVLFNNNELRHPLLDKRPEQLSVSQFVELTLFVQENLEL